MPLPQVSIPARTVTADVESKNIPHTIKSKFTRSKNTKELGAIAAKRAATF